MSKKLAVIIFILSTLIAIVGPVIAFSLSIPIINDGFPFKWSTFNFLGSNTDYGALLMDIIFWFIVIWGIWKVLPKLFKKS